MFTYLYHYALDLWEVLNTTALQSPLIPIIIVCLVVKYNTLTPLNRLPLKNDLTKLKCALTIYNYLHSYCTGENFVFVWENKCCWSLYFP